MCDDRYNRQSFLGPDAQEKIEECTVGIIGLGGGGSHIAQQLAHIGFKKYVLYDPDVPEESNLNRLIGLTVKDVEKKIPKIHIARRLILALHPEAKIQAIQKNWQESPNFLKTCNIIFGCVDGYKGRMELEAFSRRFLIPYIDIGIDVHHVDGEPPNLSGQVIASLPGEPCMKCLGFITEQKLQKETQKYGAAGHNPQVVWANGVVASTAVGLATNLLTGWTKAIPEIYLSYEGNLGYMKPHVFLKYTDKACCHYPADQVGEAVFLPL